MKEKELELQQETEEVGEVKLFALGTRLLRGHYPFRYVRASGSLKADYPAYARPFHLQTEDELPRDAEGRMIIGQELIEAFWGDLQPEGESSAVMGWPVVDVAPGQYFWLREKV